MKGHKPNPRHVEAVRARFPDAACVEASPADAALRLRIKFGRDARARVFGLMPDEHAAHAALVESHAGSFPAVFEVRAKRYVRWTTGLEDDVDEPGVSTRVGEGFQPDLSPAEAWKNAAESVGRSEEIVTGNRRSEKLPKRPPKDSFTPATILNRIVAGGARSKLATRVAGNAGRLIKVTREPDEADPSEAAREIREAYVLLQEAGYQLTGSTRDGLLTAFYVHPPAPTGSVEMRKAANP